MRYIYFDSAATTKPSKSAIDAFNNSIECFGNPSSVHSMGLDAKKIVDNARKQLANALYCKSEEIIFTACGSESNNQAIFGLAKLRARRSKRIITTDSEHPSVENPIAELEKEGFEIVKISTKNGSLDLDTLENELSHGCAFVSIMLANNETGAKYDIGFVRRLIDKSGSGALFHCDAVQGFLKTDERKEIVKSCDVASLSAHKIGGFKGVGALYVKSGIKLPAFILGGGQERGLRSGTENVSGIAAFGAAAETFDKSTLEHIRELNEYLIKLLENADEKIVLHLPESRIPTIISLSVLGVRSEVMLNALSALGICVSAGSACSARKGRSGTLVSFGLSRDEIESTLRISIGAENTKEDCDELVERLVESARKLRR